MKSSFEKILKEVNTNWLMENSRKLMDIEVGQTFDHYHAAAKFTANLIKEAALGTVRQSSSLQMEKPSIRTNACRSPGRQASGS
jgi:hypothetical protein